MLFVIDMQNDFIDQKRGKMIVKDSDRLIPGIIEKIKKYESEDRKIFYTLDIHDKMKDDKRSKEEKAWGQRIFKELEEYLQPHTYLKKIYYGIRPGKNIFTKKHSSRDHLDSNIEIVGVETEICVLSNAIIIQNMFPDSNITIDSSLSTSNNLKLHKNALEIMKNLKMEVV